MAEPVPDDPVVTETPKKRDKNSQQKKKQLNFVSFPAIELVKIVAAVSIALMKFDWKRKRI